MTDDQIEQVVTATSPPPASGWTGRFKRFARWFGKMSRRKTTLGNLITAVLVVAAIGFPLVVNSIGATNERIRESDRRANERAVYFTQSIAFTNATNQYELCKAAATAFAIDRVRWNSVATSFETQYPDSVGIEAVTQIIRDSLGPDPLVIEDCKPPGPAPVPPES